MATSLEKLAWLIGIGFWYAALCTSGLFCSPCGSRCAACSCPPVSSLASCKRRVMHNERGSGVRHQKADAGAATPASWPPCSAFSPTAARAIRACRITYRISGTCRFRRRRTKDTGCVDVPVSPGSAWPSRLPGSSGESFSGRIATRREGARLNLTGFPFFPGNALFLRFALAVFLGVTFNDARSGSWVCSGRAR